MMPRVRVSGIISQLNLNESTTSSHRLPNDKMTLKRVLKVLAQRKFKLFQGKKWSCLER